MEITDKARLALLRRVLDKEYVEKMLNCKPDEYLKVLRLPYSSVVVLEVALHAENDADGQDAFAQLCEVYGVRL